MTGAEPELDADIPATATGRWRRKRVLLPAGIGLVLAAALGTAWFSRERIAGNVVDGQLRRYDLPATYQIDRITPQRQVLRNLVVGDPARPDLTVERVEVRLRYRFGTPEIGRVVLVNPRLYGRVIGGKLSFGSLDKVIYRETGRPPGLPDLYLDIRDGRALLRTPYGPLGTKLAGAGRLRDGFAGNLAAAAPGLTVDGCGAAGVTLFGTITTRAGEPTFAGPTRLRSLTCPASRIAVGPTAADVELTGAKALDAVRGRVAVDAGSLRYGSYGANGAELTLRGNWKDGLLDLRQNIALRGVATPQAGAALVTLTGTFRAQDGLDKLDIRGDLEGNGMRPGPAFAGVLRILANSGEGTLIAPLAERFAGALARQSRGSTLTADMMLRRDKGVTTVIVPQAELSGGSRARILSLSRVEALFDGRGAPRIAGNLATGGPDMPAITGRMEGRSAAGTVFRLAMEPYAAGNASLSIPQLSLVQGPDGALGFAGSIRASGPLPGGFADGLSVPVSGRWAPGGALSLWRRCVEVGFDRLQFAKLSLEGQDLRLCPSAGRAIVESGSHGLRIAAGTPSLDLAGTLGKTPIRLSSGPIGFAYPGVVAAKSVGVALGPADTASRFTISNVIASLGGQDISGRFEGADVRLARVPLDLREASGNWRYAAGMLSLADADFRLVDRSADARFEPLVARGGTLTLRDNVIDAEAALRHPATGRVVTNVDVEHNLDTGRGHADLSVPGVLFDGDLQPENLSRRALGVVANARGTITGTGRIDWNGDGVTSTGEFSSDRLDFAAAFGPVKGARGTVRFTDLLGLTTAPGQTLQVASVNPGIEVNDGEFTFRLEGGKLLAVEGGSWPFMGGRLVLKRVDLNFGVKEARRYVFEIVGLDAAAFVTRFELPNIAATGRFDGTVPIVFDENGNGRIEGGFLISRAPGGNVSYVGDLTYKDLSPMANFAFDALRSLDYEKMDIAMNGSLTGEIVTNVRFDGVKQGEGAKRNIVTRALANLPIQFKINIRAPFYQLITSFKSLRDPAAVRDPRDIGLLSDDGTRLIRREVRGEDVKPKVDPKDIITADKPAVQN